ncbi:hypothetical protein K7X08_017316 [Anisodus acutangulus]|uniref:Uncharacterized protein n=1 Tax=Anisodus acutangulus TaxID=402998 RepID=A0A9Q1LTJ0_9SOLA|nr:hypothetical protein K7X08_017316 [Anisodus acutangulus]
MGSCMSKKNICSPPVAFANTNQETEPNTLVEKKKVEGQTVRREIFVIKHRISHEGSKDENDDFKKSNESAPLRRTSSCTKEEVDAILIQCGRLSRSTSRNKGLFFSGVGESSDNTDFNPNTSRKYSISKKSYDFDNENRSDGGSRGGSRRVSRSPVRRSESPITAPNSANGINVRPGNMLPLPATFSPAGIQRIQVKRNVGVASPRARSRSPAKANSKAANENMNFQQQPLYLSRCNSRKKDDSPFKRKPSSEIDTPVVTEPMPFYTQKLNGQNINNGTLDYGLTIVNGKVKEQQQLAQEAKALRTVSGNAAVDVVSSRIESLVPEGIRRSRSRRLSRDLDINNLRVQSNPPTQSYTELLLEDIQNFHQKCRTPAFSLPPCVTKACSIPEAVADLNSRTSSNLSSAFSEDRRSNPTVERFNKNVNASLGTNPRGKNRLEIKAPYVESEIALSDDLMEPPCIQKYATFRRGTDGGYMEELESSESNSFVGYQQRRFSPSSSEPNSADSTDSWAPSKSYSRLYMNPLAFQKCTVSDHVPDMDEGERRVISNVE